MKMYTEINLKDFEAWSGAVDTLNKVIEYNMDNTLEAILDDLYPEGIKDTHLNDLLWFDSDMVYEWLDIPTDDDEN